MRCWDGHNTLDEMHRSSGEGRKDMAQEPGVVQRVQRGKGTKHGSRLGQASQRLYARLSTALASAPWDT